MVAAIGEQILGPTDVSLSNWTVRPSGGCSVVLATHTAGVSVDGYTLTLAANPWNIVRTYNFLDARVCLQVFVLHDMCLCQLKTDCLVWLNSDSAATNVEFSKVTFNLRVSLLTRLNALNSLMLRPEKQTFCYGAERRNAKSCTLLPAKNHRHQKILPLKLI